MWSYSSIQRAPRDIREIQQPRIRDFGLPLRQFNNQEFDNIEETTQFCQMNYGVTFPIFAKINVNGPNTNPLFTFLKEQKIGLVSKNIKWNFTKFLIDRNGQVVKRYAPTTKPNKITEDLIKLL